MDKPIAGSHMNPAPRKKPFILNKMSGDRPEGYGRDKSRDGRGGVKIKLSEIPESGLTLKEVFDPVEMNLQMRDLTFIEPLRVTADLHKQRDAVMVNVGVAGQMKLLCGRCLELYEEPYENHFNLGYSVKGMLVLDITDDVREEILLSYSIRLLCKEECQGLCARCGRNLNFGVCQCLKVN